MRLLTYSLREETFLVNARVNKTPKGKLKLSGAMLRFTYETHIPLRFTCGPRRTHG